MLNVHTTHSNARNTTMFPVSPDTMVHPRAASARQVSDDFSAQSIDEALCETRDIIPDADLPPALRSFLIEHGDMAVPSRSHKTMIPCGWSDLATRLKQVLSYINIPPGDEVPPLLRRAGSDDMDGLILQPGALVFCIHDNDGSHDAWYISVPRTVTHLTGDADPDTSGTDHDFFVVTTNTTNTPYRMTVSSPMTWDYFQRRYLPLAR